ncbi:MAG: DUF2207 domain-containing protein [Candidatus Doudnabacteria bacterium]|nr:DUF2207 domain-containing protein [Candidatus Doudnabacteria bacterium]
MRKVTLLLLTVILSTGYAFSIANAQSQTLPQEAIVFYSSNITVNIDNSINVTETITYNTGPEEHHGIYRDIYPYSSQEKKMSIENVSVTDENGNPYIFQTSNSGENIRIKIGDPNRTFSGQKIYIVKYHATRAVAQLKDVDEIYWDVTGNGWGMPIYQSQASVILPSGASMIQSACYFGPKDSTSQCQLVNSKNGTYTFNTPSTLNPYEGLTAAVGFPKGIVTPYTPSDTAANFFDGYWRWIVAAILPILTLIFSLSYWYRKGRDARGTGVIVPQYDIPDGLSPMEVGGIANEKVQANNISAEIIYLATKGYLKISQLEERFIGFIKSTDYELTKLKDFSDLPDDFDRKLLEALFSNRSAFSALVNSNLLKKLPKPLASILGNLGDISGESESLDGKIIEKIKLSDLKNNFYSDVRVIIASVLDSLLNKGYYKNLGRMKNSGSRIAIILFMSVWASGFFGGIIGVFLLRGNPFPLMAGIFLSIIIYGIISHFNPAKTEKGVATKEYILGLKDYLQIAEKDRLQFHNAPDKKPEIFEKFLPYAMVLGVANIWAKEFEGIYTLPPSWYSGPSGAAFGAIALSQTITKFSSFAAASLTSSPGGSGSGGGGSSGGGGGGGGGGSW